MKAILHIGDEKTGSKAIQQLLHQNKRLLQEHGYALLSSTQIRTTVSGANYDLGLAAYAGDKEHKKTYASKHGLDLSSDFDAHLENLMLKEIKHINAKYVIFSFEGLIHLSPKKIAKLTSFLHRSFKEIFVIAFLRRQDRKEVSAYTTRLKNHKCTDRNILYDASGVPRGPNYYVRLNNWMHYISAKNIKVLDYDSCTNLRRCFINTLDLPQNLEIPDGKPNKSLSALGQEVLRRFNLELADDPRYRNVNVRMSLCNYFKGKPLLPSRKDAEEFYDRHRESNKKLGDLINSVRPTFFDEDFSVYPDEFLPVELTIEEVRYYVDLALQNNRTNKSVLCRLRNMLDRLFGIKG